MSKTRFSYSQIPLNQKQVFSNVDVWNVSGVLENQDVVVEDGKVTSLRPSQKPLMQRKVLIPAGVDTQVHLRVPGQFEKETAETGLHSALRGGVGAFLNMPNTKPFIDQVDVLKAGQKEVAPIEKTLGVRVLFSACVSLGQKGEEIAPLRDLHKAGAVAFTDDGKGVATEKVMEEAYAILSELGAPLLQHAEMPGAPGPLAEGPVQKKLGLAPYTADFETRMVERDLRLLRKFPRARYHLLHVSSRLSLPLVAQAKAAGLKVTCEVTPHHLFFSSEDIREDNKSFKMNPPLRSAEDKVHLQQALEMGGIDWVATDHAPHEFDSKTKSFSEATFGTVGLETFLPTLISLWKEKKLSLERLVEVFSLRPAQFLGIENEYGKIEKGFPFRAVLVDVHQSHKINSEELWSLSKNTCFQDQALAGRILGHYTTQGWFEFSI